MNPGESVMESEYELFLREKFKRQGSVGKEITEEDINPLLFPFQRDLVRWAVKKGQCAIFADTGLGKTLMQLEWARLIGQRTLIIAPLSVARQTVREAKKLGLDVLYVREQSQIIDGQSLFITNYEMVDGFDFSQFGAVVLDESSILKAISGKTRQKLTDLCQQVPYRLCCTATPAPNDHIELGNHAEFLGICTRAEMLAMFFINANKQHTYYIDGKAYERKGSNAGGTEWRLKHHAETPFFKWLASWAIALTKPSDLGYDDDGFILPELNIIPSFVRVEYDPEDQLFFTHIKGIKNAAEIRRESAPARLEVLKELVDTGNLVYNNNGKLPARKGSENDLRYGISETVLSGTPGTEIRIREEKEQEQNPGSESRKSGVHAGIPEETSREMEAHHRSERQDQFAPETIVCPGKVAEIEGVSTGPRMGTESSEKEEGSTPQTIQPDSGGVQSDLGESAGEVCDLRVLRPERSESVPCSGSLPQDGPGQRLALHELQPSSGEISGRSDVTQNSSGVSGEQWVIWCGLNEEQRLIEKTFCGECASIYGSLSPEEKLRRLDSWLDKEKRILVSKPRISGFGLNLQQSHNMVFFGLNYSWEQYYQCVRREWRYLQDHPVNVHIIMSDIEEQVYKEIVRKDNQARRLRDGLIEQLKHFEEIELTMTDLNDENYQEETVKGDGWVAMLGDSCVRMKEIESDSVALSVYSPPFADLYTYTDTERDLGNSRDWDEFFKHYAFLIQEVYRVTVPGRLTCVHTSDIPAMAQKDGYIGVKDFPGAVIRAYENEGWTFVGRAFVQKNPQAQAIRTKSKALLFVQLRKDSTDSRPALVDQILLFKKPGDNPIPVNPVGNGEMNNETWIEWAHGIWLGIQETDTLQYSKARDNGDEKHICPLQLGTIERCVKLYSNPGELVLSPFMGIGSEGYVALKFGRRFIGCELKESYFRIAISNLEEAVARNKLPDLFSWAAQQEEHLIEEEA